VVNVSVPGAKDFFEKETVSVVINNPRAVQNASLAASKASVGRRQSAIQSLAPASLRA